jgi:hypothetical protein
VQNVAPLITLCPTLSMNLRKPILLILIASWGFTEGAFYEMMRP